VPLGCCNEGKGNHTRDARWSWKCETCWNTLPCVLLSTSGWICEHQACHPGCHMQARAHTHAHTHMHTKTCTHMCMHTCTLTCAHACAHTHMNTHMYTCTHTNIQLTRARAPLGRPRSSVCHAQAYTRALELSPNRLYSIVQSGALQYQLADHEQSAAAFARFVGGPGGRELLPRACLRADAHARTYARACMQTHTGSHSACVLFQALLVGPANVPLHICWYVHLHACVHACTLAG